MITRRGVLTFAYTDDVCNVPLGTLVKDIDMFVLE